MDESHETLNAFVDGELPPAEMARIAALLPLRPELEAYVRRQEKLRAILKMESLLRAPVPDRLVRTAQTAPVSARWRLRTALQHRPLGWIASAAGAALAVGLVIGMALQPARDIGLSGGTMIAQGSLANALDNRLASSGYDGTGPRIGISFRSRDGRDCRTFEIKDNAGLACHRAHSWQITALAAHARESTGAYRMAGSEMPDMIRQAVEASITGAPFDAAAEERARASGWSGK